MCRNLSPICERSLYEKTILETQTDFIHHWSITDNQITGILMMNYYHMKLKTRLNYVERVQNRFFQSHIKWRGAGTQENNKSGMWTGRAGCRSREGVGGQKIMRNLFNDLLLSLSNYQKSKPENIDYSPFLLIFLVLFNVYKLHLS